MTSASRNNTYSWYLYKIVPKFGSSLCEYQRKENILLTFGVMQEESIDKF